MESAIKRAIEGGWKDTKGAKAGYKDYLLDPEFWKCLGKAEGKDGISVTFSNGKVAFCVDEDMTMNLDSWSWELQKGYVRGTKKGTMGKTRAFLHRIVIGAPLRSDEMIDHINGNRLDNRLCNLRVVKADKNALNRKTKLGKYRGVYFNPKKNLYQGYVVYQGKKHYVGYFKDRDIAAEAVDKLRKDLYGEFHERLPVNEWWFQSMHRFIDHIAEGGSIEEFFEKLLK